MAVRSTKSQILALLKRSAGCTVDELASALELARMTVRQHLATLERDNLIIAREVRRPTGRPHFVYSLTDKGEETFPKRYDHLADMLIDEVGFLDSSEIEGLSRMTFVVDATTDAEQVVKQVDKLIEVVNIRDVSAESMISREMTMVKVQADRNNRNQIIELVDIFGAEIVDVGPDSIIVEITGDEEKIESFIALLGDFEVIELVRTGRVAMLRGSAISHPQEEQEEPERYPGFEPPYSDK